MLIGRWPIVTAAVAMTLDPARCPGWLEVLPSRSDYAIVVNIGLEGLARAR